MYINIEESINKAIAFLFFDGLKSLFKQLEISSVVEIVSKKSDMYMPAFEDYTDMINPARPIELNPGVNKNIEEIVFSSDLPIFYFQKDKNDELENLLKSTAFKILTCVFEKAEMIVLKNLIEKGTTYTQSIYDYCDSYSFFIYKTKLAIENISRYEADSRAAKFLLLLGNSLLINLGDKEKLIKDLAPTKLAFFSTIKHPTLIFRALFRAYLLFPSENPFKIEIHEEHVKLSVSATLYVLIPSRFSSVRTFTI